MEFPQTSARSVQRQAALLALRKLKPLGRTRAGDLVSAGRTSPACVQQGYPPMSDKAAIKLERGTKRTCQSPHCGTRFYDLNRHPITCPICNTVYAIALQPSAEIPVRVVPRPYRKPPPFVPDEPKQEVPAENDAELATLEDEEKSAPVDEDETIIEEVDEDSRDMSDIVDAPAADDDDKGR